jgi:hypothetical protein
MRHLKEYNELDDLMGDLKSMGYHGKIGLAINFVGDEINYWNLIVMQEGGEKRAIQALVRSFYPWYDATKITTLDDLLEMITGEGIISDYNLFNGLKPKRNIKPCIIQFGGTNPFSVVKELEKIFEGPLYDAFSGSESDDLEIKEI